MPRHRNKFSPPENSTGSPAPAVCASGSGPSLVDLAALIDGSATDAERARVGRHLTECEVCREAVADLQQAKINQSAMVFVPASVLSAAMSLVSEPDRDVADHRSHALAHVRRIVAAAALIGISLAGYQMGTGLSTSHGDRDDDLEAALWFGLVEMPSPNGSDHDPFEFSMLESES